MPPELRIATPVAVPLTRSSNLDCSHVRVPSAAAGAVRQKTEIKARRTPAKTRGTLCNVIPRFGDPEGGDGYKRCGNWKVQVNTLGGCVARGSATAKSFWPPRSQRKACGGRGVKNNPTRRQCGFERVIVNFYAVRAPEFALHARSQVIPAG